MRLKEVLLCPFFGALDLKGFVSGAARLTEAWDHMGCLGKGSLTFTVKPHPGDVIPHTLYFPAWQCRLHHCQIGFATGTGESSCHIALFPCRVGDPQNLCQRQREQKEVTKSQGVVFMDEDS